MRVAPPPTSLWHLPLTFGCALVLVACASGDPPQRDGGDRPAASPAPAASTPDARRPGARPPRLGLRRIGTYSEPVFVTQPPGESTLAIVERTGRVLLVRGGATQRVLVDIAGRISLGGEQGLLGLAFHPGFARNRRLFINHTDSSGDTRVVEYHAGPAGASGQARRVRELLNVAQPYENHNGGNLAFGPDGYLYVGLGDGGDAGDPENRAQDPGELLGKLLRLDVDPEAGPPYGIPDDNPWAGDAGPAGGRDEVWAYGLRNPWRYSFDRETGDLYIADVGQGDWEEIHVQRAASVGGENYGWDAREGFEPFPGGSRSRGRAPVDPVYAYSHDDGCSVTGGYVYRGERMPALRGWYLFADFCSQWIRALPAGTPVDRSFTGRRRRLVRELPGVGQISSFGEDARGELYVSSLDGGVYQIVPRRR